MHDDAIEVRQAAPLHYSEGVSFSLENCEFFAFGARSTLDTLPPARVQKRFSPAEEGFFEQQGVNN